MPVRSGDAPVGRVRETLSVRVEAVSLRHVAREVGMSPSGLKKFLDGTQPYSATRRKLERWYVREGARYESEMSAGSAFAALRVLVQDLPPMRQHEARKRLLSVLELSYNSKAGDDEPDWLAGLRELVDGKAHER